VLWGRGRGWFHPLRAYAEFELIILLCVFFQVSNHEYKKTWPWILLMFQLSSRSSWPVTQATSKFHLQVPGIYLSGTVEHKISFPGDHLHRQEEEKFTIYSLISLILSSLISFEASTWAFLSHLISFQLICPSWREQRIKHRSTSNYWKSLYCLDFPACLFLLSSQARNW
jgi:hypothetical protein